MTTFKPVFALLLGAFVAASCATSIDADTYDRTCEVDADCVVVAVGDACNLERCSCPNSAISIVDQERFIADSEALVCLDPLVGLGPECLCADVLPSCDAGTCSFITQ
jgi:hypothetical protein